MRRIISLSLLVGIVLISGCVGQKENAECQTDGECVPATCCHADSCVPKSQAPDCSGIFCTENCEPGTMDCGCGYCSCIDGECQVIWTRTEGWC